MSWRQKHVEKARVIESIYGHRIHQLPDSQRPESKTKLYAIYHSIKQRCNNPNNKEYHIYGGRGIKLSIQFSDFIKFKFWALSHGYQEGLTIDRLDNDEGYSPENCQWITKSENIAKSNKTRIGRK